MYIAKPRTIGHVNPFEKSSESDVRVLAEAETGKHSGDRLSKPA